VLAGGTPPAVDEVTELKFSTTTTIPSNPAPPVKVTVTDAAKAQDAYQTALALPVDSLGPSGFRSCPPDYGVTYQLTFLLANGRSLTVIADPTGCQYVDIPGTCARSPDSIFWSYLARDLGIPESDISPYSPGMPLDSQPGVGVACTSDADCSGGLSCGYAVADGCAARGVCVQGNCQGSDCLTPAGMCGCDGQDILPVVNQSSASSLTILYTSAPSSGKIGPCGASVGWDTPTGSMTVARESHTATLLDSGLVLVAGGYNRGQTLASAELYDPAAGTFTNTASMTAARQCHTATLLRNGKVLIAGGQAVLSPQLASAELYDPVAGTFAATGSMSDGRCYHTATLLPNGKVLIVGGIDNMLSTPLATAELYDPSVGTFAATGSTTVARESHTATLLDGGMVLIAGGDGDFPDNLASAELYDPSTGTFALTGYMTVGRDRHTATLLSNGKVLIVDGTGGGLGALARADIYDPSAGTFARASSPSVARADHTATLLPNGTALIAGGDDAGSAELFDPGAGTFTVTRSLTVSRILSTATLLPNGTVLIAGGTDGSSGTLASAELYLE
jgi:hypothetical protein